MQVKAITYQSGIWKMNQIQKLSLCLKLHLSIFSIAISLSCPVSIVFEIKFKFKQSKLYIVGAY